MDSLILLGFYSLLFAAAFTPVTRDMFLRLGLVDKPDSGRKRHPKPIPRVGGIPIAVSYAGAFAVLLLANSQGSLAVAHGLPLAARLMPAAALIFLTGLVDDLRGLKPWQKLCGQAAAAALAFWAGVHINAFQGLRFESWLSFPLTVLWLVGCANAFNLIDGVDGLAAGVGLFATVTMLLAALLHNNMELALVTVPLAGCLLGFLRYNFSPATIFLGDSGSLLIGFLLGSYGALWSQKSVTALGMTAPLMALAVPLLDASLAVVRRFLRGQPIFGPDLGHIHHRLLARGLTPRRVALVLYGACGLAAVFSLLQSLANNRFPGLILILFCAVVWIGTQRLGYVEFRIAGQLVLQDAFRRALKAQLAVHDLQDDLAAASTPDECWQAIRQACGAFGFTEVRLSVAGRCYAADLNGAKSSTTWTITIPFSGAGFIRLGRPVSDAAHDAAIALFVDTIHVRLVEKLPVWLAASPAGASAQLEQRARRAAGA